MAINELYYHRQDLLKKYFKTSNDYIANSCVSKDVTIIICILVLTAYKMF